MATTAARRAVPTLGLLTASGLTLAYTLPRPRHRCDSYSNPTFAQGFSLINPTTWRFFHSQQPPPPPPPPPPAAFKTTFNPTHYRQISSGSFLGLFAGLAVARFSRPLAVIAGLLVCIVEVCYAHGSLVLSAWCLKKKKRKE